MSAAGSEALDANIAVWKLKQLVKGLQAARGAGTSMISLIIPPRAQISQITNMLTQEYGTGQFKLLSSLHKFLTNSSFQHQITSQQTLRPWCHHFHPTTTQIIQSNSRKWFNRLLWNNSYR